MLEKTMAETRRGIPTNDGFMLILFLILGAASAVTGNELMDSSNSLVSVFGAILGIFGVLLFLGTQFYVVVESLTNALSNRKIIWIGAILLTGTLAAWIYLFFVGDWKWTYREM
jgi:hypothetical protein